MTTAQLETEFAPAARCTEAEIMEQHALFRNQRGLVEVLDAMPNMVAILNPNRQIVLANREIIDVMGGTDLKNILGLRPGELLGCKKVEDSPNGCGTGMACRMCKAVEAILEAQAGQVAVKECSIQPVTQMDAMDLRIKATPMNIEGESFVMVAIQDIAGEKRVELLERTFFHDIMNAAGGVQGLANLVDDAGDMDEVQEYASLLAQQAEELVEAIEAQRDMLSAERGELVFKERQVDSLAAMQATIDLYRSHQVAEGKTIQRCADAEGVVLTTGKALLLRTLGNMVKNALEASKPGDTVTIGCRRQGDGVRFQVQNPAVMSQDVQLQIFNRSFSTKGAGRGIGTYSMKLLGENYLQGQVDFSSVEGQGTCFWIDLPLNSSPTAD